MQTYKICRDFVLFLLGAGAEFKLAGIVVVSQRRAIRTALLQGRKVSALTALRDFGVMRLASRILEIRQGVAGDAALAVSDTWRKQRNGKRFKVYSVSAAVSERYKAVLLGHSKAGTRRPGRPRLSGKASRPNLAKVFEK